MLRSEIIFNRHNIYRWGTKLFWIPFSGIATKQASKIASCTRRRNLKPSIKGNSGSFTINSPLTNHFKTKRRKLAIFETKAVSIEELIEINIPLINQAFTECFQKNPLIRACYKPISLGWIFPFKSQIHFSIVPKIKYLILTPWIFSYFIHLKTVRQIPASFSESKTNLVYSTSTLTLNLFPGPNFLPLLIVN